MRYWPFVDAGKPYLPFDPLKASFAVRGGRRSLRPAGYLKCPTATTQSDTAGSLMV